MAEKKKKTKYNTWTEPKITGSKRVRKPSLGKRAEAQRRGMAATRKRQQAGRPAPMTLAQMQAVRDRDLDAAAKAARRRARRG